MSMISDSVAMILPQIKYETISLKDEGGVAEADGF